MLFKLKLSFRGGVAALAVASAGVAMAAPGAPASGPSSLQRMETLGRQFMKNAGQWDSRALYHASSRGLDYWITRDGAIYDFFAPGQDTPTGKQKRHMVSMEFVGGKQVAGTGLDRLATKNRFLTGQSDTVADSFGRVLSKNVYPNIDAMHYFNEKQGIRYDLIVQPGGDASNIKLRFNGATGLHLDGKNDLVLGTSIGDMGMGGLYVYQVVDGARKSVPARFKILGDKTAGFDIGAYDKSKPLVIDPLVYGSYFGGDGGSDKVTGVVSEPDGAIYMTGYTQTPSFPARQGGYQVTFQGQRDAFVTRFRGDAYNIDYNTFLGGSGSDEGLFIATDPEGKSLYVLGKTTSANLLNGLPANIRSQALQPTKKNGTDLFLFRFDKVNGTELKAGYGSFFAPSTGQFLADPVGFKVTPSGLILVAGSVNGEMPNARNSTADGNIFVTAFSTRGRSIRWSRYFGKGFATVRAMDVDRNGNYFLAGTAVPGFPLNNNGLANGLTIQGDSDAFLAKFDAESNTAYKPIFSAAIGGREADDGFGVAIDQDGNAFVLGFSSSFDFPRTQGTYGQIMRDTVTITKIRGNGSELLAGTALNTSQFQSDMVPVGLAVDGAGNVAATGRLRALARFTDSGPASGVPNPNVPIGSGTAAIQVTQDDDPNAANYSLNNYAAKPTYTWIDKNNVARTPTWEGWVNVLDGNLTKLIYGSYVGGDNNEEIMPPYADLNGDLWIFGRIDTALAYIVPGRIPDGGGNPPDPLRVLSNSGFYQDLTNPAKPRRFITPLAFKAIPERFPSGWTLQLSGDSGDDWEYTVLWFGVPFDFAPPFSTPPFVSYATQTDGFVSRFRFSAPTISNVALSRNIVPGGLGQTTTVTVNLSLPAPAQGADVRIDLSSIDYAQFQGSTNPSTVVVTIPAGATQGTATVETKPVTAPQTVQVTANYRGNVSSNSITVVPWLTQIAFTPNQTRGGFRTTGTITLADVAPTGGIEVPLSSSNTSVIDVPATVLVPEGQRTVNFDVNTQVVTKTTAVVIKASLLGVTRSATITVDPFLFTIQPITFSPATIVSGGTSTGTVMINVTAPDSGLKLNLVSSDPAVTVPATVTIDPGATTATFTARGGTPKVNTTATVTASFQSISNSGTLTVQAVQFSVSLSPTSVIGGQGTVTGTITLDNDATASQDLTFRLRSDNTNVATVTPDEVMIEAGSKSATFTVTPKAVASDTTANIFAGLVEDDNQVRRESSAALTVQGVRLSLFRVNPTALRSTTIATGTIVLEAPAPAGGVVVTLQANTSLYQIFPAGGQVVVPAGQTTVTFSIKPKRFSLPLTDAISATAGGVTKSVLVTIQP